MIVRWRASTNTKAASFGDCKGWVHLCERNPSRKGKSVGLLMGWVVYRTRKIKSRKVLGFSWVGLIIGPERSIQPTMPWFSKHPRILASICIVCDPLFVSTCLVVQTRKIGLIIGPERSIQPTMPWFSKHPRILATICIVCDPLFVSTCLVVQTRKIVRVCHLTRNFDNTGGK